MNSQSTILGIKLLRSFIHKACLGFLTKPPISTIQGGAFPGGSDSKKSTCNVGDPGLIPGLGRSPEEGHGNPL